MDANLTSLWYLQRTPRQFTEAEVVAELVTAWRQINRAYMLGTITDPADLVSQASGIYKVAERLGLEAQYDAARSGE